MLILLTFKLFKNNHSFPSQQSNFLPTGLLRSCNDVYRYKQHTNTNNVKWIDLLINTSI